MMLSATLSTLLLIPFAAASVFPTNATGAPGSVRICTQPGWQGDCEWLKPTWRCHSWDKDYHDGKPDSTLPAWGGYCLLYDTEYCEGEAREKLVFPGRSRWGFRPTSMLCSKCEDGNMDECRCRREEKDGGKCGPCLFEDGDGVRGLGDGEKPEWCDYPDRAPRKGDERRGGAEKRGLERLRHVMAFSFRRGRHFM